MCVGIVRIAPAATNSLRKLEENALNTATNSGTQMKYVPFSKTHELLRLADMAAAREDGVSLEEIKQTFGVTLRSAHPEPPDGPKALDRVMQRAAQRKADEASRKRRKPKNSAAQETRPMTDLPVFYAEMVNSDRYLPVSAISNSMRDAMLARGLVTAERLRERGIR
jgi:DNA-binding transcriptional MerR regulator